MAPSVCVVQNAVLLCPILSKIPDVLIMVSATLKTFIRIKGLIAVISVSLLQISAELSHAKKKSNSVVNTKRHFLCAYCSC